MPLVEFFGIGAPRSGTSWIAKCLDEHPCLAIPVKETHHFSREAEYLKGEDVYEQRIRSRYSGEGMVGEFCPNYLGVESCAKRLYSYNPNALLVAILRNPIDRAYSHFLFEARHEQVNKENGILHYINSRSEYLLHGYYFKGIQRFLDAGYSKDKILILFYEEINLDPVQACKKILEHLSVDTDFVPENIVQQVNPTRIPRSRVVERVFDFIDMVLKSPQTLALRKLVLSSGLPSKLRRLNSSKGVPGLTFNEREALLEYFKSDVRCLENYLGRRTPWSDFQVHD